MESNRLANLVSWLRISAAGSLDPHVGQAADAIEAQAKRIEELKAALRPFAEVADLYLDEAPGNYSIKEYLSRFRTARKVLEGK